MRRGIAAVVLRGIRPAIDLDQRPAELRIAVHRIDPIGRDALEGDEGRRRVLRRWRGKDVVADEALKLRVGEHELAQVIFKILRLQHGQDGGGALARHHLDSSTALSRSAASTLTDSSIAASPLESSAGRINGCAAARLVPNSTSRPYQPALDGPISNCT